VNGADFLGKIMILVGLLLALAGSLILLGGRFPFLGRLPGDIYLQRKGVGFYFPLGTCILVSIVLSLVLWLWMRR